MKTTVQRATHAHTHWDWDITNASLLALNYVLSSSAAVGKLPHTRMHHVHSLRCNAGLRLRLDHVANSDRDA